MTVKELLTPQDGVLGPQIPLADVSSELQASQCQTIRIPGTSFEVIPSTADLAYLAHCRAVNAPNERPGTYVGAARQSTAAGERILASPLPCAPYLS